MFNHYSVALVVSIWGTSIVAQSAETNTNLQSVLPKSSGTVAMSAAQTIAAGQSFDGGLKQYDRSPGTCMGQTEGGEKDAVFIVQDGGTISNVIIGPNNGEGIHCKGPCTLNNVWWSDVCEDAVTIKQTSGTTNINGGGAFNADDKVIQHNGGGTVAVKNFYANTVGKLYRSCGNCITQYPRNSTFSNVKVDAAKVLAGVNGNLGDTTSITDSCFLNSKNICELFNGTDNNDVEPTKTGTVPDGKACATSGIRTTGC